MPSMQYLFGEMEKKHVTFQLLWYEYRQGNPDGYQYSYFCELYNRWRKGLDISLRQEHWKDKCIKYVAFNFTDDFNWYT